jgi:two-component system, OmpR family, sensor histidine kinase SenX3
MRLAARLTHAAVPAAIGAILLLLVLLATLQYRWAGELSAADGVRLRTGARARAEAFSRDLDLEVTRAALGLQMEVDTLRGRDFRAFAGQHAAWRASARHPELLTDLYLVESRTGNDGDPGEPDSFASVLRFEAQAGTFQPASWPEALAAVRQRLHDFAQGSGPGRRRGDPRVLMDRIVGEVPALLLPIFDRPPRGEGPLHVSGFDIRPRPRGPGGPEELEGPGPGGPPQMTVAFGPPRPAGFLVIVLEPAAVLSSLAALHFGDESGHDFDLAVVEQADPGKVVWRSRPDVTMRDVPDAVAGLLDLRPEELPELRVRRDRAEVGMREFFSGVPAPAGPPDGPTVTRGRGFARGPSFARAHTESTGHWRLLVAHRGGPLDEVVASARRRNLAVGFGILVLLGAAVALVVVSSQRARRLGERQMEFVAAVSHELRTPVAVICSTAENLADGVVQEPAQVRVYGGILRDEGRRLGEMIEHVLQFAGSAALRAPRQDEVDMARVVDQALGSFAHTLRERGFTVEKEIAPGMSLVCGDELILERAVRNLLENALKFDTGARWLRVQAGPGPGEGEVHVTVEDRGPGIAPADLPHVFEPFFRGEKARESQVRGFGLGLALVDRVVQAHRGRLTVSSVPGGGSAFTIHLPAIARALAENAHTDVATNPSR